MRRQSLEEAASGGKASRSLGAEAHLEEARVRRLSLDRGLRHNLEEVGGEAHTPEEARRGSFARRHSSEEAGRRGEEEAGC